MGQSEVNTPPSSANISTAVNDEFNPDLTYSSAGSLGFAIPSPNEGSSEFFIGEGTSEAEQALNYSYSLFGFQTVNQSITVNGQATTVLGALEADSTSAETASGGSGDLLNTGPDHLGHHLHRHAERRPAAPGRPRERPAVTR